MLEQPPPRAQEAERGLLGALLVGNLQEAERLCAGLEPQSFYSTQHCEVFRAIQGLIQDGVGPDLITVSDRMRGEGTLEDAGGASALAQLCGALPTTAHTATYRSMVLRAAQRRFLYERVQLAQEALRDASHANLERPVALLEEIVHDFGEHYPDESSQFARPLSECVDEFGELLDRVADGKQGIAGRPSGYTRLDQLIAGFQPGRLYTIAARTGAGKTTFICNLAYQMARDSSSCAVFSLEMGSQEVFQKLVAIESGLDLFRLRQGVATPVDLDRARGASASIASMPILVNDGNKLGLSLIERDCARLKQANQLDAVFVDYLQLMWTPPSRKQRYEAVGELSRGLKAMARKLDVPVIACAQLSRKADEGDGEPKLHHLRESGSIEQDSDVVLMLWRDGMKTNAKIAKNRNGPTGRLEFNFDAEKERFTEENPNRWNIQKEDNNEQW